MAFGTNDGLTCCCARLSVRLSMRVEAAPSAIAQKEGRMRLPSDTRRWADAMWNGSFRLTVSHRRLPTQHDFHVPPRAEAAS